MAEYEHWSVSDVLVWLDVLGLPQYKENFKKFKIDGNLLGKVTAEDLEHDLEIKVFEHRNKILKMISFGIIPNQPLDYIKIKINCQGQILLYRLELSEFCIGNELTKGFFFPNKENPEFVIKYEEVSNRFYIQDLNSKNGTFLRLPRCSNLFPGMVFSICGYIFTVKNIWRRLEKSCTCKLLLFDGRELEFGAGGCSIGKNYRNSIVLPSFSVKSVHAVINNDFALECLDDVFLKLDPNLLYPFHIGSLVKSKNYEISLTL